MVMVMMMTLITMIIIIIIIIMAIVTIAAHTWILVPHLHCELRCLGLGVRVLLRHHLPPHCRQLPL